MTQHKITISQLGDQGDGIGVLDDGQRVYIDKALPGDQVLVSVQRSKDGFLKGRIDDIIVPSPHRAAPPCSDFDQCGGCQMQHVSADFYRDWKISKTQNLVQKALGVDELPWQDPVFIPQHTRRRVTFAAVSLKGQIHLGYRQRRSKKVTSVRSCLLLDPVLSDVQSALSGCLKGALPEGKVIEIFLQHVGGVMDCVFTGPLAGKGNDLSLDMHMACSDLLQKTAIQRISWRSHAKQDPELILQNESVFKRAGKYRLPLRPLAFLQPSDAGEDILCQKVVQHVQQSGGQKVADLFAGYGTFTGCLAQEGFAVDAFEGENAPMQVLKQAGHGQSFVRDLFTYPLRKEELKAYDVVILDPPRAGAKDQVRILADAAPSHVIYVSCSPTSFSKDAKVLMDSGFEMRSICVVDQFIWSPHAELVSYFVRVK